MKHKSKQAFTLVELLVVIAIIAVLLAVLMPAMKIAKALSQRVVCKNRLGSIGKGISFYADQYDGKLPSPAGDTAGGFANIRAPYEVLQDPLHDGKKVWLNLGCLIGAQMINGGKQLYCPANIDGQQEFEDYSSGVDSSGNKIPAQWGTIPNWPTHTSTWWHVSASHGYCFWPQSKVLVKNDTELHAIPDEGSGSGVRHAVGYPHTPVKYTDVSPNKSIACDYSPHTVQGSGYNIQAVFGDTHVSMQKVPVDPVTGQYWYPYQSSIPEGEAAAKWREMTTAIYMYALQP